MSPVCLPPAPPAAIVFEERVTTEGRRTTSGKVVNFERAVLDATQIQTSDEAAVSVSLNLARTSQPELMALPTVEFRGQRSTGLPRGRMIVMRKPS